MDEYKASYSILCGEQHDTGKKAVSIGRTYLFEAKDGMEAYRLAIDEAKSFAYDYKTSPETGLTLVLLKSIKGIEGKIPFNTEKSLVILNKWDHLLYYWLGYLKK